MWTLPNPPLSSFITLTFFLDHKIFQKKKKKSKNKQNIEANTWADQKNLKPGFHLTETEKGEDVYPSNPNKLYREKKKREQTEEP